MVDHATVDMDCTSDTMEAAFRASETVKALKLVVVEIKEQQAEQEPIDIDNGLPSDTVHELDEDFKMDQIHNVDESIMAEDDVSKEATISVAKEEDAPEVEGSDVTTETDELVESVKNSENVENPETRRVPRKRSEWLTAWLIEAAEWEGRNWNRSLTRWNTL